MPLTAPFGVVVASSESPCGIRRLHTSCRPSRLPMVKTENDAGLEVL